MICAEGNENFPVARRVSTNKVWEMSICPVLFGYRVRVGPYGKQWYSFDYCAADDSAFLLKLYITVVRLMELLPESITEQELQDMIPTYQVRPINLDPCWFKLVALVKELESKHESYRVSTELVVKHGNSNQAAAG